MPVFLARAAALAALTLVLATPPGESAPVRTEVAPSAEEIRPLLVGSRVPEVHVRQMNGNRTSLASLVEGKPTILVFYRGGWCPICNRQLAEIRHITGPLERMGFQLLAVSGDSADRLVEGERETPFTLLSDYDLEASKAFGLAFHVEDAYVDQLKQYDLDTSGNSVSSEQILPVPAVFVVGADGIVHFSYVNPNYKVRANPDVILAAAKAALFALD